MGNCGGKASGTNANCTHIIYVKTGDKKGAETDGNIFLTLKDENSHASGEFKIDTKWKDDFENGSTDVFYVEFADLSKITEMKVRRDQTAADDSWYVEKVVIEQKAQKKQSIFPIHRWISANAELNLVEFDCTLPQFDAFSDQRAEELKRKRERFKLKSQVDGLPRQIEILPPDESFSSDYKWDIQSTKLKLFAQTKFIDFTIKTFKTLKDFEGVYKGKMLTIPYGMENWKSDAEFGNQRLSGCNPVMIKLCQTIPENLAVNAEMIEPFFENQTLAEAIGKKKLYILDLSYMCNIECTDGRKVPGPIALFYSQKNGDFVPVAIQLMPTPGPENPVFLPSDPEYTWLNAKMWFNYADASHHQSVTHLGFTHLIMESVAVVTHRQLSPSHPIFRLLAPHFLYLLAINTNALNKLVSEGGWVDTCMGIGRIGMFNIIKENWSKWNLMEKGNLVNDLKTRGVDDAEALPNYHYRDDALLMWTAIEKYATTVVNAIYDTAAKLQEDTELQAWASELADSTGGADLKGCPSTFTSNEQLSEVLTVMIFTASVGHAAANFCQYDEYAFPPNYPAMLKGEPPKDKSELSESDIVNSLPNKETTLSIMLVCKILSERGTNELGNFEVQYAHDPITMSALKMLKSDLAEVGQSIDAANAKRLRKYVYLHPREVPNAISI